MKSIDQLVHALQSWLRSYFLGSIFLNTDSGSHSRYPQNQTLGLYCEGLGITELEEGC